MPNNGLRKRDKPTQQLTETPWCSDRRTFLCISLGVISEGWELADFRM